MGFQVTSIYAAILGIAAIVLSVMVSTRRGKHRVTILDGGHADLAFAIRRHGNFIEVVPLTLLLMAIAEARGFPPVWLHVIGIVFVVSRLMHAVGMRPDGKAEAIRGAGMAGTLLSLLVLAIYLLVSHF